MVAVTQQLVVPQTKELTPVEDIQFIVRSYSWRPFLGFFLPHIDTLSPLGLGSAPLFGEHALLLTREQYCLECLEPTMDNTQYCDECSKLINVLRFECVTKGAGTPYNQHCNPNQPPCHSPWAAQFCGDEHVVYIAGFGELFKVGVTRAKRWNSPDGYKYRLVEQAADCATVLRGDLNLTTAQELEQQIAETLGLERRVGFEYKAQEFANPHGPKLETLEKLSQEAAQKFNLHPVCTLDLSEVYGVRPEFSPEESIWYIDDLLGKVVYIRGNILYFQSNGLLLAHDMHSMRGRGIICEED